MMPTRSDGGEPGPRAEAVGARGWTAPDDGALAPFAPATSLHQFLTDGRLARLCDSLGQSAQAEVLVLDENGRRISVREPLGWSTSTEPVELPAGAVRAPMVVAGNEIGALAVLPPPGERAPDAAAVRTVHLIAETAAELCGDVQQARQHAHELGALFSLSAILVGKTNVRDMLQAALDSVLMALGLDAGSLVLFPDGATPETLLNDREEDVRLQASRGLSETWLNDPMPLSRGREFDLRSMRGEVVSVADLQAHAQVLAPERLVVERLGAFIGTGLIIGRRPIGVLRLYSRRPREFTELERRLVRSIGQQAAAAVQQGRLIELQRAERQHQRQLELARSVQQRMLPRAMPRLPGLDVAAYFQPSLGLSGDFYDVFERGPSGLLPPRPPESVSDDAGLRRATHLGILVGDVVGKGLPAALLMASIRGAMLTLLDSDADLARVLSRLNTRLTRDTRINEFATIWAGLVDAATRELRFVCAGHDPPLLFRLSGGGERELTMLTQGGLVVGVEESLEYESYAVGLRTGDVLVCYTDGFTEARGFDDQVFGADRLAAAVGAALGDNPSASASDIVERVRWELRGYVGLSDQSDDQTLVVLRVTDATG